MNDVALIRVDAVQELAERYKFTHAVIVNSEPVEIDGKMYYPGPIVISTVPEDLVPKERWFKQFWSKIKMFVGGIGFR